MMIAHFIDGKRIIFILPGCLLLREWHHIIFHCLDSSTQQKGEVKCRGKHGLLFCLQSSYVYKRKWLNLEKDEAESRKGWGCQSLLGAEANATQVKGQTFPRWTWPWTTSAGYVHQLRMLFQAPSLSSTPLLTNDLLSIRCSSGWVGPHQSLEAQASIVFPIGSPIAA